MYKAVAAMCFAVIIQTSYANVLNEVMSSRSSDQLERVLLNAKGRETSNETAILWGSILLEGARTSKDPYPTKVAELGREIALRTEGTIGDQALRLWWMGSIGQRYAVPDFRKAVVQSYGWITVNGKRTRVPVYTNPEENKRAEQAARIRKKLAGTRALDDKLILYRIYNADPKVPVTTEELTWLANNRKSPWRLYGVVQLSVRERRAGKPGPWTDVWLRAKEKDKSLMMQTLITLEREGLKGK